MLDAVAHSCVSGDLIIPAKIPKGSSRGDALKHVHHVYLVFSRGLQLEAEIEARDEAQKAGRKSTFLEACNNFESEAPPIDGLEDPLVRSVNGAAACQA